VRPTVTESSARQSDGAPTATRQRPPEAAAKSSYLVASDASAKALANSYTRLRTAESVMR